MNPFRQLIAVTSLNFTNIPRRWITSLIMITGVAAVVTVLITVMAMNQGFARTMRDTIPPDRAVIVRSGTKSEINGAITFEQADIIRSMTNADIAPESFVSINLLRRDNRDAYVSLRGVTPSSFKVRPEINIINGRNLQFGKHEMVVGSGALNQFKGLEVGGSIRIRNTDWRIVGVFDADESLFESEIWIDVQMLNEVFNRGGTYSSIALQMGRPGDFALLESALDNEIRVAATLHSARQFYGAQSALTTQLINGVGAVICIIMLIGAVFSVLNSTYAAVADRRAEIGTLRALGFNRIAVITSVGAEATLLALTGGLIAAAAALLFLDGLQVATIGTNTQVAFRFIVTTDSVLWGITLAFGLGSFGAIAPAINAARMPIVAALR